MLNLRTAVLLVSSVACFALSGCVAAFRQGDSTPQQCWPLAEQPGGKSICLILFYEMIYNGENSGVAVPTETYLRILAQLFRESGLFSKVVAGPADTELRAELHLTEAIRSNAELLSPAVIFSLGLIPAVVRYRFTLKTTLKNNEGVPLATHESSELFNFWIGLFFICAPRSRSPSVVLEQVLYDLGRPALIQAYAEGHFQEGK